jgi:tRNA-dihydrouridine synthase
MSITLLSSPLQGFTDYRFRNSINRFFGGIDTYYAPYIRLNGKFEIKPIYERDLALKNNASLEVIPQVMTCDADEFLFVAKYVRSLGYTELNWNLGCPYPMVTNRGMGSGMINSPDKIDQVLDRAHSDSDILVSMKMRMGYAQSDEILRTFPVLAKYPLKNIAIHARIGAQLYDGGVDLDAFERCVEESPHKLYYNGDITSVAGFREMQDRFPSIDHWMLGRGLIADPFLPMMIKNDTLEYPENRMEIFSKFHDTLFYEYEQTLSGAKHVIMKMLSFWEYFSLSFPNSNQIVKKIKKAKTIGDYDRALHDVFNMVVSL